MNDLVEDFARKYAATIEPSSRQIRQITNPNFNYGMLDPESQVEYEHEYLVAVYLPQNKLQALVEHEQWVHDLRMSARSTGGEAELLIKQHKKECLIRNENHAVKAAYQKYQTLLKLVESSYDGI